MLLLKLCDWNRDVFGHSETNIRKLEGQISYLHSLVPTVDTLKKVNDPQKELDEWLVRSKNIWRQISRELWLSVADWNSKFFHTSTIANKRCIFIAAMKDENYQWLDSRGSIGNFLRKQFTDLFKAEDPTQCPCLATLI